MTLVDWLIVLLLNGTVIGYGLYLARGTKTSGEWFLASRALPWWAVGLSMFATNVDNADLVSVTGKTFNDGLHILTVYALGSAVGGILAAFWIVPAIARRGFYTNAEYLEARFGPSTRILSALIQIQYRTSMLGLMIWSAYLMLTKLVEIEPFWAWLLIVMLVVLSGIYTAWGGLKSVVWTDAAQGLVMMAAAIVIFFTVWRVAGGWSGLEATLAAAGEIDGRAAEDLTHIGRYHGDHNSVSPYWVVLGWTIVASGYWTVNHTQTMRLMGSRSFWDMKLAAVFGVALSMPVMIVSAMLGVLGRAIPDLPEMASSDELYPLLARTYLGVGFKGLVVAGVVAAVVSTFDSMGSALSAVFTRDVYARFVVRDKPDSHYVFVGRLATGGVLLLGFLYLPFIWKQKHMLDAFTTLIPVFVTPLFTIYMAGVFTPAHRRSGWIGLACGSLYGIVALVAREFSPLPAALADNWATSWLTDLPTWFTERWIAFSWSMLFTAVPMAVATLVMGTTRETATFAEQGWLARSRQQMPTMSERPDGAPAWLRPGWFAVGLMVVSCWVTFVLFW